MPEPYRTTIDNTSGEDVLLLWGWSGAGSDA
jgi:hypothetical protein